MAVVNRLTGLLRNVRFRQWDLDGGPAPVLRLAIRSPLATTAAVAIGLGAVFAAVFGVPPVSPLVLVVLVVAPLYPWLRAERRLYHEWCARAATAGPDGVDDADDHDSDDVGDADGRTEPDEP